MTVAARGMYRAGVLGWRYGPAPTHSPHPPRRVGGERRRHRLRTGARPRSQPHGDRVPAGRGSRPPLRAIFGDEQVSAYVSPYRRTHQTFRALALDRERVRVREEPRLREQDWGNWQDRDDVRLQKAYRDAYGHFFYRFAQGESGADVYDRVGAFLESLWRSFEDPGHPPNVLIVTHGLTMRLFCMRWFHWTVADFESLSNPGNAERRTLLLGADGRYSLDRPFERWCVPEPYGVTG